MIKGIIGTVIGDIAGSTHEGKPVKIMRFDTLNKQSTVTDDTVLTMAVAEWMLDRRNVSVRDSLIKWPRCIHMPDTAVHSRDSSQRRRR